MYDFVRFTCFPVCIMFHYWFDEIHFSNRCHIVTSASRLIHKISKILKSKAPAFCGYKDDLSQTYFCNLNEIPNTHHSVLKYTIVLNPPATADHPSLAEPICLYLSVYQPCCAVMSSTSAPEECSNYFLIYNEHTRTLKMVSTSDSKSFSLP